VWFRLARLAMVSPALGQHGPRSGENPPIGAVQIPRATSIKWLTVERCGRVAQRKCLKTRLGHTFCFHMPHIAPLVELSRHNVEMLTAW
jgi:hypothetical protein